jgi:hypothetical protein
MTVKFGAEDATPVDLLAFSEGLYRDVADELARTLTAVQSGDLAGLKSATQVVKELKDAFKIAMDERTRIDKLRQHTTGVIASGSLDFDAARDEIGRRLACLRDAGSGG